MKLQYAPADTISRLAEDLRFVEAGVLLPFDLSEAPIIYNHRIQRLPVGSLEGVVEGHPRLGSGKNITTSQVFFIDTEWGVARTLSRWYRLDPSPQGKGR
ncbi:DUF6634 family protein [Agrobacterium sp. NPDC090273]|uniref:DUF6634 family protein n=1 Tax=Agrobacterium sp. NPDC090273 TaxID=3363919 RepID=UPI00383A3D2F